MIPDPAISVKARELLAAVRHSFAEWPNLVVPQVAAGVYAVWREEQFVYVGMSGRGLSADAIASHRKDGATGKGLFSRLASHAAGRRSGDQFCVYVADRFVLPTLSSEEVGKIGVGELSFDRLVAAFIRQHLAYSFVEVADGRSALAVEDVIRCGEWQAGTPLLNPSRVSVASGKRGAA